MLSLDNVERTTEFIAAERSRIRDFYTRAFLGVLCLLAFNYFTLQKYFVSFVSHRSVQIIYGLIFFWQIVFVLLHWYLAPITKKRKNAAYIFVSLASFAPIYFYTLLGPAIVIIIDTLVKQILGVSDL